MEDLVKISHDTYIRPEHISSVKTTEQFTNTLGVSITLSNGEKHWSDYNLEITKLILARKPKSLVNLKIWEAGRYDVDLGFSRLSENKRSVVYTKEMDETIHGAVSRLKVIENDRVIIEHSCTVFDGIDNEFLYLHDLAWNELKRRIESEIKMSSVLDK